MTTQTFGIWVVLEHLPAGSWMKHREKHSLDLL